MPPKGGAGGGSLTTEYVVSALGDATDLLNTLRQVKQTIEEIDTLLAKERNLNIVAETPPPGKPSGGGGRKKQAQSFADIVQRLESDYQRGASALAQTSKDLGQTIRNEQKNVAQISQNARRLSGSITNIANALDNLKPASDVAPGLRAFSSALSKLAATGEKLDTEKISAFSQALRAFNRSLGSFERFASQTPQTMASVTEQMRQFNTALRRLQNTLGRGIPAAGGSAGQTTRPKLSEAELEAIRRQREAERYRQQLVTMRQGRVRRAAYDIASALGAGPDEMMTFGPQAFLNYNAQIEAAAQKVKQLYDFWRETGMAGMKIIPFYNEMGEKLGTLAVLIDENGRVMYNFQRRVWDLYKDMMYRMGVWAIATANVYMLIDAVRQAIAFFRDFERQLVMTQIAADNFDIEKLTQGMARIAQDYGAPMLELIGIVYNFSKVVETEAEALELARQALIAYNISGLEYAEAGELVIGVLKQFNLNAEQMARVLDAMAVASKRGTVDFQELFRIINASGSVLASAGMDIYQIITLTELVGTSLGQAGANVSGFLRFLAAHARDLDVLATLRNEIGIPVMTIEGQYRGLWDILKDLASVWNQLSDAQKAHLAVVWAEYRQQHAFMAMMNELSKNLDQTTGDFKLHTEVMHSYGEAIRQNQAVMETLDGRIQQLGAAYQEMIRGFTDSPIDFALKSAVSLATELLQLLNAIPQLFRGPLLMAGLAAIAEHIYQGLRPIALHERVQQLIGAQAVERDLRQIMATAQQTGATLENVFGRQVPSAVRMTQSAVEMLDARLKAMNASAGVSPTAPTSNAWDQVKKQAQEAQKASTQSFAHIWAQYSSFGLLIGEQFKKMWEGMRKTLSFTRLFASAMNIALSSIKWFVLFTAINAVLSGIQKVYEKIKDTNQRIEQATPLIAAAAMGNQQAFAEVERQIRLYEQYEKSGNKPKPLTEAELEQLQELEQKALQGFLEDEERAILEALRQRQKNWEEFYRAETYWIALQRMAAPKVNAYARQEAVPPSPYSYYLQQAPRTQTTISPYSYGFAGRQPQGAVDPLEALRKGQIALTEDAKKAGQAVINQLSQLEERKELSLLEILDPKEVRKEEEKINKELDKMNRNLSVQQQYMSIIENKWLGMTHSVGYVREAITAMTNLVRTGMQNLDYINELQAQVASRRLKVAQAWAEFTRRYTEEELAKIEDLALTGMTGGQMADEFFAANQNSKINQYAVETYKQLKEYQDLVESQEIKLMEARQENIALLYQTRREMFDLLMQTDEYAGAWQRVQERISLAREIMAEMVQMQAANRIISAQVSARQRILGPGFDSVSFRLQALMQRWQQAWQLLDRIQELQVGAKSDEAKIRRAIAEVEARVQTEAFQRYVVDPMAQSVDRMSQTIDHEASVVHQEGQIVNEFGGHVRSLGEILDNLMRKYASWADFRMLEEGRTPSGPASRIAQLKAEYERLKREIEARGGAVNRGLLNRLDQLRKEIQALERSTSSAASAYAAPVAGVTAFGKYRITSPFGYRRDPFTGQRRFHSGIDLAIPYGTPVGTIRGGRVVEAGYSKGWGYYVKVRTEQGVDEFFAHLSKILVKKGQQLAPGQAVGRVGSTGRSTGPHLHFGLYRGGKPIDPSSYIRYGGVVPVYTSSDFGGTNLSSLAKSLEQQIREYTESIRREIMNLPNTISKAIRPAARAAFRYGFGPDPTSVIQDRANQVLQAVEEGILDFTQAEKILQKLAVEMARQRFTPGLTQYEFNVALSSMRKSPLGSLNYYMWLDRALQLHEALFTLDDKIEMVSQLFEKLANKVSNAYEQLNRLQTLKLQEEMALLKAQLEQVNKELARRPWWSDQEFVAEKERIRILERMRELEEERVDVLRKSFRMSGEDLYSFSIFRADLVRRDARTRQERMSQIRYWLPRAENIDRYYAILEEVVALEQEYNQLIEDRRAGLDAAFKLGLMSLNEYIKRLRELQNTAKQYYEGKLEFRLGLDEDFQRAFSSALSDAFRGSFDYQQQLIDSMKGALANSISQAFTKAFFNYGPIQSLMDRLMNQITENIFSGNFDRDAFKKDFQQILDIMNYYLPKYADLLGGILATLEDAVYNAPSGFKLEPYLYEFARGAGWSDFMPGAGIKPPSGPRNEYGSPIGPQPQPSPPTPAPPPAPGLPSTPPQPTPPSQPPDVGGPVETSVWRWATGAYTSEKTAKEIAKKIHGLTGAWIYLRHDPQWDNGGYRLISGAYTSEASARAAMDKINSKLGQVVLYVQNKLYGGLGKRIYHEGGIVSRFGPRDVPAILEEGELVLTRRHLENLTAVLNTARSVPVVGGDTYNVTVNVTVNGDAPADLAEQIRVQVDQALRERDRYMRHNRLATYGRGY